MITLCTLFDSTYSAKGLSLIASLRRHVPDFVLYVLCLDDAVYVHFEDSPTKCAIPIRLAEIETPELLKAKANRTQTEFCWTLASVFTDWCVTQFNPPSITYLDADCYFFSDPSYLYDECQGFPVAITPHRWTPSERDRLKAAGTYNVGWVYFERDGYECLRHWRNQCLEWCKWQVMPDGRFADQGYLGDWPARYGAHEVYNLGVNLAPWNQAQYDYILEDGRLIVSDWRRDDPLILYHFHGFISPGNRTGYPLHPMVAEHVYEPYEAEYARWMA